MQDDFKKIYDFCESIPGAFEPQSLSIFITISRLCSDDVSSAIEFGVLHGKSASALVHSYRDITLVDKNIPTYINQLKEYNPSNSVNFVESWSSEFLENIKFDNKFSFCHIDTSHYFDDTVNEFSKMTTHMTDLGVIVLDDWNDMYQQVRAGYFYSRYKNNVEWDVFLVAHNKAYLCKKDMLSFYLSKVSTIKANLDNLGYKSQLIRTDDNPLYCPFYLRPLKQMDEEYYGTVTYGDRFFKILEKTF